MAEEDFTVAVNGGVSETMDDDQQLEAKEITNKLKQKIEALEHEKRSLLHENEEIKHQVLKLTAENDSAKSKCSEWELKVGTMEQVEMESRRALESVAKRAVELETEVSRLQHDLVTAMSEGEEAHAEISQLKLELREKEGKLGELKKEKAEAENKMRELERKIGVLEVREVEEKSKKVRMEEEMRERVDEKEKELIEYKKRVDDLESEKEGLEDKLVKLQTEIDLLNERTVESGERGIEFKQQWPPVAVGSTTAAAVIAAVAVGYACYASRT